MPSTLSLSLAPSPKKVAQIYRNQLRRRFGQKASFRAKNQYRGVCVCVCVAVRYVKRVLVGISPVVEKKKEEAKEVNW